VDSTGLGTYFWDKYYLFTINYMNDYGKREREGGYMVRVGKRGDGESAWLGVDAARVFGANEVAGGRIDVNEAAGLSPLPPRCLVCPLPPRHPSLSRVRNEAAGGGPAASSADAVPALCSLRHPPPHERTRTRQRDNPRCLVCSPCPHRRRYETRQRVVAPLPRL